MRMYEHWRPKSLADVLGQDDVIEALMAFVANPHPIIMALEGPTGCGKTTTAMIIGEMLADTAWFGNSVYRETSFDADRADYYFGKATTPFRFCVSPDKFHVLIIEELERLHPSVQATLKEAIEDAQRRYKLIVIATSNDTSLLAKALRHRFKYYFFQGGEPFADAINNWLPTIWAAEMGGEPMPFGWQSFGWDGEQFSARLAVDRLEMFCHARKAVIA